MNLDDEVRQILEELMNQFLQLLEDPGAPILHRIFPPAYSDPADVALQDEYRQLMMEDLVERRRQECQVLLDTASQEELTEDQLLAWSRTINSLRLALGTYLNVSEDDAPRPPETTEESAYNWLTWMLEESIEALSRNV